MNESKPGSEMPNYDRVKSDAHSAESYAQRKPAKHQAEMNMVSQAVQLFPADAIQTFLDAPCGVGRLSLWLGQKGFAVTAIDLGEAAVELTKKLLSEAGIDADVNCQNVFDMVYEDNAFDATICFRLLHHFGAQQDQQALINELCRCTKKYVLISYISPYSFTSIRRKIRNLLTGKPIKQNPNSLKQLQAMFHANGCSLFGRVKRSGFLHSLQLAVFIKNSE